jgi:hypothetical protein
VTFHLVQLEQVAAPPLIEAGLASNSLWGNLHHGPQKVADAKSSTVCVENTQRYVARS